MNEATSENGKAAVNRGALGVLLLLVAAAIDVERWLDH